MTAITDTPLLPSARPHSSSVLPKANSIEGSKMGGSVPAWSAATCASIAGDARPIAKRRRLTF